MVALYECKNGLADGVTRIMIGDEYVANFLVGQFFLEPPDIERFRRQAAEFGFDEAAYLDGLSDIPIVTREQTMLILDFLARLSSFIGEMGLARVKQIENTQRLERASQEIIEAQRAALRDLSTPIIPVVENIIVMPLVGNIDSTRAREITRALLAGITEYRAKVLILDITGVAMVDSGVADHLNKAIQAARLKGAEVILTGVSDAVAETIVDLGIDWSSIATMRDLQTGLASAIERLGVTF
jgi:anti-anti-sigma regulatory factor